MFDIVISCVYIAYALQPWIAIIVCLSASPSGCSMLEYVFMMARCSHMRGYMFTYWPHLGLHAALQLLESHCCCHDAPVL